MYLAGNPWRRLYYYWLIEACGAVGEGLCGAEE